MGFKIFGNYFQSFDKEKRAHTYQIFTYTIIANSISDSHIKTINDHTKNILKWGHGDANRREGGEGGELWHQVSKAKNSAAIKCKNISYTYFSTTDNRQKYSPDWLIYYRKNSKINSK